ncbi:MAG: class I SAM-dependent methyltransferase [Thermoleophilaceae bacterium]
MLRAYLRTHSVAKLQIGAGGGVLPGWLNTDRDPGPGVAHLDATRPFPLPDRSFDYVFGEHVIEHLTRERAVAMLRECRRVLKPGGRVRMATPDLERIVSLRGAEGDDVRARYVRWSTDAFVADADRPRAAYVINQVFRGWQHQFIYDEETLAAALVAAGLSEPVRRAYGASDDPALAGIETHGADQPERLDLFAFEALILEAGRPAD